jgi:hypothetical protein
MLVFVWRGGRWEVAVLDPDRVGTAIELQERSYKLLKWVNSRLQGDTLGFNVAHQAMSAAEAAEEWMGRHWASLPLDTRPAEEQLPSFARLFASYLTTSFELREDPPPVLVSRCGCFCSWCSYLAAGTHLRTKKVTKKAKENAREMKRVYLQGLASDLALEPGAIALDALMDNPALSQQIALAT